MYPSDGEVVVLAGMRAGMMAQGAARAARGGGPQPGCAAMHVQRQARPDRLELTFWQGIASLLADGSACHTTQETVQRVFNRGVAG